MLPRTLQYSGIGSTAGPSATVIGEAGTRTADVIVAPEVGSPRDDAGMDNPRSDGHGAVLVTSSCEEAEGPVATHKSAVRTIGAGRIPEILGGVRHRCGRRQRQPVEGAGPRGEVVHARRSVLKDDAHHGVVALPDLQELG